MIKMKKLSCGLTLLLLLLASEFATADQDIAQLQVKPARCIALHEGQVCYQTLTVVWSADQADNYCLYQQENKSPLQCWENTSSAKISIEFENNNSSKFILQRKRDNKNLAEFTVEVAWVYDASTHRESHWRMF
jgi:hypothetical protein